MNMKGILFEGCKAKNNEEYRRILEKRQGKFLFLLAVGVLTVVLCFVIPLGLGFGMEDILAGDVAFAAGGDGSNIWLTIGIGTGLTAGALIAFIKIRHILSDEGRLKEERLKETDEREQEISNRSLQKTAKVMLMLLYVFMLYGCFADREVMRMCQLLIIVFLFCFVLFQRDYEKKM